MGRSRYKVVTDGDYYFVTSTVVEWQPIFSLPYITEFILESLQFNHQNKRITIYAYVVMENHIHLLGSSLNFNEEMRKFKSYTARQIIDYLKRNGPVSILDKLHAIEPNHTKNYEHQIWQEGFHPQLIQNENMLFQKLEYIHYNPVRRGYVDSPEHWRDSSARQYLGQDGLVDIERIF